MSIMITPGHLIPNIISDSLKKITKKRKWWSFFNHLPLHNPEELPNVNILNALLVYRTLTLRIPYTHDTLFHC